MAQKEQGAQVEEAGNADNDLKLDEQSWFEGILVRLDRWIGRRGQVIDHKYVSQIVH